MVETFAVGADPEGLVAGLEDAPSHVLGEALAGAEVREGAVAELDDAGLEEADPEMALAIFKDGGDVVGGQPLRGGVAGDLAAAKKGDSAVVEAHPEGGVVVLMERGDVARGWKAGGGNGVHDLVFPADEVAGDRDPDGIVFAGGEGEDGFRREIDGMVKDAVGVAGNAFAGAYPEDAVGSLGKGGDLVAGQAVAGDEAADGVVLEEIEAVEAADPEAGFGFGVGI